jgi:AraC-like DNA-binding protein
MDQLRFTTDVLAERERLRYWREVICDTFVELECESAVANGFHASIDSSSVGEIQFSNIKSDAQRVVRTRSKIARSDKDYFLLSLQTHGRGVLAQGGRTAVLGPGDFALYDTTQPYDLLFEDTFGQLVLRFPRNVVMGRLADAENLTAMRIVGNQGVGRLTSIFLQQLHAQLDELTPLAVAPLHANAVDLVATALAEQAGSDGRLTESQVLLRRRIGLYIDRNLADPSLSCERIATDHGISERYLRKLFEKSSRSVSEWIWARRLDQAKRDLADPKKGHLSVTAIGYDAGFKDAAHFSRAFKTLFGETPSSWRASNCIGVN